MRNGEIASRLHVAESTVKTHLTSAYLKLGVKNRTQAAIATLSPTGSDERRRSSSLPSTDDLSNARVKDAPLLRGNLAVRLVALFGGLVLFGVAIVLMLESELGLPPWDVLHYGIAKHTPLPLGTAGIVVGLIIVAVTWLLGTPPGFGTIANAIVIGVSIECCARSTRSALSESDLGSGRTPGGGDTPVRRRFRALHRRGHGSRPARFVDDDAVAKDRETDRAGPGRRWR